MNDVFIDCYTRPIDGSRLLIPSEWRYVFRDKGGIVVVALLDGRLVLVTKEMVGKFSDAESLKPVYCKMDSRGRITIPKVFRGMFDSVKNAILKGLVHYVEVFGE